MRCLMRIVLVVLAFRMLPIILPPCTRFLSPERGSNLLRLRQTGITGCSLGVIRDGDFVYRKAYGLANLELGVPLSPQSVFYMGSISKQFTAASVVLAAEQGYLSLDDDVRKYIPELPDYGHVITLRQMIHQTSGFRDFFTLLYLSGHDASRLDKNGPPLLCRINPPGSRLREKDRAHS